MDMMTLRPGSLVGLTSWSGSLKNNYGFQTESTNDTCLDPELTDTAASVYRPLYDLDPITAPATDQLDDDTRIEFYKGSDEELVFELLNRKRKRDELDGRADSELLTREWKQNRGRGGSSVDRPIVLSDSEEDGDAADEFVAPTPVPVGKSDGVDCFGWLEY